MPEVSKPVILVVDDTPTNIRILNELLGKDYFVRAATSGKTALEMVHTAPIPDLILLDIMMPEMDGYEVCVELKKSPITSHIPVIFVTAMTEEDDEAKGLDLGAADYITKPYRPRLVRARVQNHLAVKKNRDELYDMVRQRTDEISRTRAITIETLASLAETRDPETGKHIRRTQHYVRMLATQLRRMYPTQWQLSDEHIDLIYTSTPLHDIGKVGIPDTILLKPGALTAEEFDIMKLHTVYGYEALAAAEKQLGESSFLRVGAEIANAHHEKWDGSGYPNKLAGEDIPMSGRLMALADVYDALVTKRVYKPPLSHQQAMDIIIAGSGKHFDPQVSEAFVLMHEAFNKIAVELADL